MKQFLPLHHLRRTFKKAHPELVHTFDLAWDFALTAHSSQHRLSGEAYISHPLQVALSAEQYFGDGELTIACLLHDTVEDCTEVSLETIYQSFGNSIGYLVEGLTKTILTDSQSGFIHFEHYYEKLLLFSIQDIRVLLLKLVDRQHNISTCTAMEAPDRCKMLLETLLIYVPLMTYLPGNEQNISKIQHSFLRGMLQDLYEHPSAILEGITKKAVKNNPELFSHMHQTVTTFADLLSFFSYVKHHAPLEDVHWMMHTLEEELSKQSFFQLGSHKRVVGRTQKVKK